MPVNHSPVRTRSRARATTIMSQGNTTQQEMFSTSNDNDVNVLPQDIPQTTGVSTSSLQPSSPPSNESTETFQRQLNLTQPQTSSQCIHDSTLIPASNETFLNPAPPCSAPSTSTTQVQPNTSIQCSNIGFQHMNPLTPSPPMSMVTNNQCINNQPTTLSLNPMVVQSNYNAVPITNANLSTPANYTQSQHPSTLCFQPQQQSYFNNYVQPNHTLSYLNVSPPTNYLPFHPNYNYQLSQQPYQATNQHPHSILQSPSQPQTQYSTYNQQQFQTGQHSTFQNQSHLQPTTNRNQPMTSSMISQPSNMYQANANLNNHVPNYQYTNFENQIQVKNIHPLPEFDGNPERWPFFYSQFTESTKQYQYSNLDNTSRLYKALKGKALQSVSCFLVNPQNVDHVIKSLEFLFGRPELLLDNALDKIKNLETIPETDGHLLVPMSIEVQQIVCLFEQLPNDYQHLNNPIIIRDIVDKLPLSKREQWTHFSFSIGRCPTLKDLSYWINQQASVLRLVTNKKLKEPTVSNVLNKRKSAGCIICNIEHTLFKCPEFKKLSVNERWEVVKKNKLCSSCLRSGHSSKDCKFKQSCAIENCQKFHSRFLHNRNIRALQITETSDVCCCDSKVDNLLLKIIPIKVYNGSNAIETYALIDEGSKISFVDSSLLEELNLDVSDKAENSIRIKWYGKEFKDEKSRTISLEISGMENKIYTLNNIKTIKNTDLPTQSVNTKNLPENYGHFRNLPISYSNAKPRILLGLSHSSLVFPQESEEKDGLIASNTKLGWIIHGSIQSNNTESTPSLCLLLDYEEEENLNTLVKNYINTDNLGLDNIDEDSNDDTSQAMKILESTTRRIPGTNKFETGLLWRNENSKLPNNFNNAFKRLLLIEKRMETNPDFARKYEENLMAYVTKGYAKLLSKNELKHFPGRQWYLPHFVSLNINKPKKFRIVFDAAAKFEGVSLNSQLMKGPDLNQSLIKVLFNFRIGKFGVCADIKEMFNQINIIKEDQHCQRFLWRHGDKSKPLEIYVMTAMLFGAACSPCSAQYVKNINAMEHLQSDKQAAEAILEQHYVDDFVMSFESEEQAIRITKDVRRIHNEGGFLLTKFVSNSNNILEGLGETIPHDELNLNKESDEPEKILGLHWNRNKDTFIFKSKLNRIPADILDSTRKPTKREVLRIAMSIYDPFGFLLYFTIICKILLQEIWKAKTKWDEQIDNNHFIIFKKWQERLKNISDIQIPRCYFMNASGMDSVQLHIFTDASASAYSAVAYIRIKTSKSYTVSFIMGKAKVAPINKISSIPRLELQAALLGCKLKKIIVENLKIEIKNITFWCDSQVVLHWIHSNKNDFKIFVSNRIKYIQENSKSNEWRYVNTKLNVADYATKIKDNDRTPKNNHIWIIGPDFLRQSESEWNMENSAKSSIDPKVLEPRNPCPMIVNVIQTEDQFIKFEQHSSYHKLQKLIGWILRAKNNFLSGWRDPSRIIKTTYLQFQEWIDAEVMLCKKAQGEAFSKETDALASNRGVDKSSSIKKLCPYLDENGLIRVNGRLDLVESMSYSRRRPIILPKGHPLTLLIIKEYHERFKHQNKNLVINEVRTKFWVISMKSQLNKVIKLCQHCKMTSLTYEPPIMSPLPDDRTKAYIRPFSYCGIDYCGHFLVKNKRSVEKRWIVIINCLTTRAVHLETLQNLTADSCLLSLNNFMNRRGTPLRLRSDNAGYFTSANKVLTRIFHCDRIQRAMNSKGIQWLFNCPETPHVGGAWERLVQCVKKIICKALSTYLLKSDVFNSVVIEAEGMINSRPLLDLPDEPEDDEPLTPNHFLMGTSLYHQTPVLDQNEVKSCKLRKQFRMLNNIKYALWNRWENEYLSQFVPRQKWYSSTDPPHENDLVIFQSRNVWQKGIITKLYRSKDNIVRYVDIKTSISKEIRRAIHNLKIFRNN